MADSNTTMPTQGNANSRAPIANSSTAESNLSNGDGNSRSNNSERRGGGGRGRGREGRGRGRGGGGRDNMAKHKKGEKGRGEWARDKGDKRQRNEDEQAAKRQKLENGEAKEGPFSKDEIAAEERKPKRKVAVLIGYAGSGYKGMQINGNEKTIEGDLFNAFVAAGAISKANADDPKKSSLVRCARTDKGVHAAGNVISLKLIVEDPDVVSKINDALPPQIRVWGFERTNGAFSCYQTCDSRWYEYLIPTYSFLPPHPQSFMGRKLVESARTEDVLEEFEARQEDAKTFWAEAEEKYIKPIMDKLDPQMQTAVMEAIHTSEEEPDVAKNKKKNDEKEEEDGNAEASTEEKPTTVEPSSDKQTTNEIAVESDGNLGAATTEKAKFVNPLDLAIREVKAAYLKAKKAYRISPARRQRVQDALSAYLGTRNFHNYTIQKTFRDPSAKRVIRSFLVGDKPIIINDTEWLSLKVHGQSFMMHQIRKMVAMVALVVRCGTPIERIQESYGPDNISIPKAPGLGLLLERPVFDSYNERAVSDLQREKIDFDKYKDTIEEFKQREIYERIFREEEKEHQFHTFFHHIDHYRTSYFLWVTASGIKATQQAFGKDDASKASAVEVDSEDERDVGGAEEG